MSAERITLSDQDIELAETLSAKYATHRKEVFTAVLTALLTSQPESAVSGPTKHKPKPMAPTEFFAAIRPAQETDRVLCAGYFLETYGNVSNFTVDHVKQCLLQAKIPPPANISLAILRNAQKGLMVETGEKQGGKKAWTLTQMGIEAVQGLLRSESEPKK